MLFPALVDLLLAWPTSGFDTLFWSLCGKCFDQTPGRRYPSSRLVTDRARGTQPLARARVCVWLGLGTCILGPPPLFLSPPFTALRSLLLCPALISMIVTQCVPVCVWLPSVAVKA